MTIYRLPGAIRALAFDMDLTLYTNPEYGQYQLDSLVERLGKVRGISFGEMNREIEEAKEAWALSHDGKKPSLSNLLLKYGVSMEETIRWRNEIYRPEKYIEADPRLARTLEVLSRSFTMGVVTNNTSLIARRTLRVLGAEEFLTIIVGVDTCMTAKPHRLPFAKFSELAGVPPEACVAVGDRYHVDLEIPLEMGMGGILVTGVEDVYTLPEVLKV